MTLEHELPSPLSAKRGEKRAIGVHCPEVASVTRQGSKALGGVRHAEGGAT